MRYFRRMVRANEKRRTWKRLTTEFQTGTLSVCFIPVRCASDAVAIVMAEVVKTATRTFA